MLYQVLSAVTELWSIGYESKAIIEKYHHPSVKDWESGALSAQDLTEESRAFMLANFIRNSAPGTFWRRIDGLRGWLAGRQLYQSVKKHGRSGQTGSTISSMAPQTGLNITRSIAGLYGRRAAAKGKAIRLLEKTPENCLRLPFLQALFPDARLIFLHRNGPANIYSLMEGWQQPHLFPGYQVPIPVTIPGQTRGRWAFTLIPGWRELVDRPLAEVCAWQWVRCNEAVLDYLARPGALPALRVSYEDLVLKPDETLIVIAEFLGLPPTDLPATKTGLPQVNITSKPDSGKWRSMPIETIDQIAPIISPLMIRLGYRPDDFFNS